MKQLVYETRIKASAKKVWTTMLNLETYREWVSTAWPGSTYEGKWDKGSEIRFIAPGYGGTLATIVENKPYEYVLAKHIAIIGADGSEDRHSDTAKEWVGITEGYSFAERNGETHLRVEIQTSPKWEKMFDDGWPKALEKLKEICERQLVAN